MHKHGRGRRHGPPWDFWHHGPPNRDPREWRAEFERFLGQPPEDHWMFGGRRFRPWQMGEAFFNPFVAMALSKGGGLLPLVVLNLIADGPQYGNALMAAIEEHTSGAWGTNPGAIYPLLNDLEEQGLITGEWDDPERRTVRHYAITERGLDELARLKAVMQPKLQEAITVLKDLLGDLEDEDDSSDDDSDDDSVGDSDNDDADHVEDRPDGN